MRNLFSTVRLYAASSRAALKYQGGKPRRRVTFERLEGRQLLTVNFDIGSLMPENGGDGTEGFSLNSSSKLSVGDVNGDQIDDMIAFNAYASSGTGSNTITGMACVVFGKSGSASPVVDVASLDGSNGFVIQGVASDTPRGAPFSSRNAVSAAGDVNGDGVNDIVLGWNQAAPDSRGKAYVVFGRDTAIQGLFPAVFSLGSLDGENGFTIHGVNPNDHAGFAVELSGDLNHDGIDDLVVGAVWADADTASGVDAGKTYVVFGRNYGTSSHFPANFELSTLNGANGFSIEGVSAGDYSGSMLRADGDLNGDSISDLVISARYADPDASRADAGQVYVLFGRDYATATPFPPQYQLSSLSTGSGANGFVVNGVAAGDHLVWSSLGGDLNNDGIGDLALAATRADVAGLVDAGEAYVIFGKTSGYSPSFELASLKTGDGSAGFAIPGVVAGVNTGASIRLAGDVNGDAIDDLLLAAIYADPEGRTDAGEVYLIYGRSGAASFSPTLDLRTLSGSQGVVFQGAESRQWAGYGSLWSNSLYSSGRGIVDGDMNGDGIRDILISDWTYTNVIFGGDFAQPGVTVGPRTGLATDENLTTATFSVVLDTQPTADVMIRVSSDDTTEGTVNIASLVFTASNWNVPQIVTVTGVDDAVADGNQPYTIRLEAAVSADPDYNGLDAADVAVTNLDNDTPPTKFFVVDDGTANQTFEYSVSGSPVESYALGSANATPRGIATTAAGDKVWVVDANRNVYVYDAAGAPLGSWTAGSLASNAIPEGIATNGTDIWIVDNRSDKVFRYAGAATRLSGSQTASSFSLASGNTNPKDIVTDGTSLWVVNDATSDKVFKYALNGTLQASWTIDTANKAPTGITLDPTSPSDIWIVDNGTDRVYQYTSAASRTGGSQPAAASFALAAGNTNPQGIADPPTVDTMRSASVPAWAAPQSLALDFVMGQPIDESTPSPARDLYPIKRVILAEPEVSTAISYQPKMTLSIQIPRRSVEPVSIEPTSSQSGRLNRLKDQVFMSWDPGECLLP
jgi:FG-GAP repeat